MTRVATLATIGTRGLSDGHKRPSQSAQGNTHEIRDQRAPLTPWPFVGSLLATLAIVWLAIVAQMLAATLVQPADVLRYQ